jgi:hypothetical protein
VRRPTTFTAVITLVATLSACGLLPWGRISTAGTEELETAPKPDPLDSAFGGCGANGAQPDYTLNQLKNRIDEGQYLPVSWSLIAHLPWPRQVGYRFRHQWTAAERGTVRRFEGVAIEVEGYLIGYRLEIPEPPNCYAAPAQTRDYHMWLAELSGNSERNSVVVEVTPRVRALHPAWNEETLGALVSTRVRVRIRGWLMLDQMHPESVGLNRATLWEVHPIMELAWQTSGGDWVTLDSLAPRRR